MRRLRALPLLALTAACGGEAPTPPVSVPAGAARLDVYATGEVALRQGDRTLLVVPVSAFALGLVNELSEAHSYDPYWLDRDVALIPSEPPPGLRWRAAEGATAQPEGEGGVVNLAFEGGVTATLRLASAGPGTFRLHLVPESAAPVAFIRFGARVDPAEGFYGLGGAPDHVMHRGFVRPMQLEPDLSLESASNELHVPVPLLIGTTGWGLFVRSNRLGVFDVASAADDLVTVTYGTAESSADGLELYLFAAEHPLDITGLYYRVTGAPKLPAEWAYGPLIWRDESRDQAEVEDDIQKIRDLDLATSAIWIDRPYASGVNSFDFDPQQFPDPARMIQRAHDAGLRVSLWHTPYLSEETGPLLAEAETRGFFPPQVGLRLNGWGDPIDFTNPEAYAWWQGLIRRYTDMGIEGFKLDYGEDLIGGLAGARVAWRFADGSTDRTMHRDYTLLYHQVYAETLPAAGGFLLCRAGRWGDQVNVSVIWPGDLDADLTRFGERVEEPDGGAYNAVGGLPTGLIMGLGLGPSGFPFYGADTGGYRHSPPDEETFLRWVEVSALSSVMQVGDSSSQPPWVYTEANGRSDATLDVYRGYARLHMRLFPYAWSYAGRLATEGRAITRPLGLAHPEVGAHPFDTYLFGDDLLVAPVIERGARTRAITFPRGRWEPWGEGEVVEAQDAATQITVSAPLEHLPLYVRAGALIPLLRPDIDTLAPVATATVVSYADEPGLLYVRVVPATDATPRTFELFDGTRLSQTADGALTLGYAPGGKFGQGAVFELKAEAAPGAVATEAGALPEVAELAAFEAAAQAWRYADGWLRVKVAGAATVTVTP
jgi:alpha-D-xyloside xylohydrolase